MAELKAISDSIKNLTKKYLVFRPEIKTYELGYAAQNRPDKNLSEIKKHSFAVHHTGYKELSKIDEQKSKKEPISLYNQQLTDYFTYWKNFYLNSDNTPTSALQEIIKEISNSAQYANFEKEIQKKIGDIVPLEFIGLDKKTFDNIIKQPSHTTKSRKNKSSTEKPRINTVENSLVETWIEKNLEPCKLILISKNPFEKSNNTEKLFLKSLLLKLSDTITHKLEKTYTKEEQHSLLIKILTEIYIKGDVKTYEIILQNKIEKANNNSATDIQILIQTLETSTLHLIEKTRIYIENNYLFTFSDITKCIQLLETHLKIIKEINNNKTPNSEKTIATEHNIKDNNIKKLLKFTNSDYLKILETNLYRLKLYNGEELPEKDLEESSFDMQDLEGLLKTVLNWTHNSSIKKEKISKQYKILYKKITKTRQKSLTLKMKKDIFEIADVEIIYLLIKDKILSITEEDKKNIIRFPGIEKVLNSKEKTEEIFGTTEKAAKLIVNTSYTNNHYSSYNKKGSWLTWLKLKITQLRKILFTKKTNHNKFDEITDIIKNLTQTEHANKDDTEHLKSLATEILSLLNQLIQKHIKNNENHINITVFSFPINKLIIKLLSLNADQKYFPNSIKHIKQIQQIIEKTNDDKIKIKLNTVSQEAAKEFIIQNINKNFPFTYIFRNIYFSRLHSHENIKENIETILPNVNEIIKEDKKNKETYLKAILHNLYLFQHNNKKSYLQYLLCLLSPNIARETLEKNKNISKILEPLLKESNITKTPLQESTHTKGRILPILCLCIRISHHLLNILKNIIINILLILQKINTYIQPQKKIINKYIPKSEKQAKCKPKTYPNKENLNNKVNTNKKDETYLETIFQHKT